MTLQDFNNCKIGDMVVCNKSFDNLPQKNWKGKIVYIKNSPMQSNIKLLGIEWEEEFSGHHNCDGRGKTGYCRYYDNKTAHFWENENMSILTLKCKEQLEFNFT